MKSDYYKYIKITLIDVLHDKAINKRCSDPRFKFHLMDNNVGKSRIFILQENFTASYTTRRLAVKPENG